MEIQKSDYFYILLAIAISAVGVVAIGNPNTSIGLYGLVGLLGIAIMMTIIIKPSFGALILILAIFINISDNLTKRGYPGLIKPLVVLVAVGIVVHYAYADQLPRGAARTRRIESFIFLYLLAMTVSFFPADNKDRAISQIVDLAKDIAIIYCIVFALRRFASWTSAAWVIILSVGFLCTLGLYQIISGNYDQTFIGLAAVQMEKVFGSSTTPRLSGPVNEPNVWGQILVAIIPLVAYRILNERRSLVKLGTLLILGLMLAVIFNTYSRGAYLALLLILALILIERRLNSVAIVGALGLLAVLVLFLPSNYIDRFRTLTLLSPASEYGVYQDSSFRGRASEMLTGLRMFAAHPLLGVGTGNYPNNYQQYAQLIGIEVRAQEREPHSLYVQLLAETGVLGTIAFLGMVVSLMGGLARAQESLKQLHPKHAWLPWVAAIRLSIIGYILNSLFLHMAYVRYFWILVAMALALIQIIDDHAGNSHTTEIVEVQS